MRFHIDSAQQPPAYRSLRRHETTGAAEIAERDQDHVPEVKANSYHVKHQKYFPDKNQPSFDLLGNTWCIFYSTAVVVFHALDLVYFV